MIDLHSHVLPGLDDGAEDLDASLGLARAAAADGVRCMVATPHVDLVHHFELGEIAPRIGELNAALAREGTPLAVMSGAEVSLDRLADLDDDRLRALTLGGGTALLIESPYSKTAPFLEEAVFDLQVRGFVPVLGHPERSSFFQADPGSVRRLVDRGVVCSVDTGSITGRFGSRSRRMAFELLGEGLVHNVASDSHDLDRRPPGLSLAFEVADHDLPGIADQADWYTREAPEALLEGEPLPPRPAPPRPRRKGLRRLLPRSSRG